MSREFTAEDISKMNKLVQQWGSSTRMSLKGKAQGTISANLKTKNKYNLGLIEAVGFQFPRHGVFVEMGVFGGLSKKEAIAQGKLKPKPWFNPVIEAKLPKLAEGLGKVTGSMIINAVNLKIKNT